MGSWLVKLKGNSSILEMLAREYNQESLSVSKESDGYYLTSSELDALTDEPAVREYAPKLIKRINVSVRLTKGNVGEIAFAGLYRLGDDGIRIDCGIVGVANIVLDDMIVTARGTVGHGETTPAQPTLSLYERWNHVAARYPVVDEVLTCFDNPGPRSVNLIKVYELIRDDVGDKRDIINKGWATGAEIDSFRDSMSSRHVLGDEARHATLKYPIPPNPMQLPEAERFVKSLLEKWLNWKEAQLASTAK